MTDELKERVKKKTVSKRILRIRLVHWDAEVLNYVGKDAKKDGRYNFDFYGIGIGGYYLGLFNSRLKRK